MSFLFLFFLFLISTNAEHPRSVAGPLTCRRAGYGSWTTRHATVSISP